MRFRLADSVPQEKLKTWREEREQLLDMQEHGKKLSEFDQKRVNYLFSEKVKKYLDAGYGSCSLKHDDIAQIVATALKCFEGIRYKLSAWCIMPNHVHVVVRPHANYELSKIVRSWKSFTSKEANKILKQTGVFWEREYFDHIIRSPEYLERTIEYVWKNPDMAGLKNWRWRWKVK